MQKKNSVQKRGKKKKRKIMGGYVISWQRSCNLTICPVSSMLILIQKMVLPEFITLLNDEEWKAG